jgi:hypothetical protein
MRIEMAKKNEITTEMVSLRLESRMKEGIDMLAKKQFSSATAVIKQAIDAYLLQHGINWRDDPIESDFKTNPPAFQMSPKRGPLRDR